MLPAPASRGRLCCRGGLTASILLPPRARPSLHSPTPPVIQRRRQRSQTSEPSYSSPCGHPLLHLPWLRVVPFLGLAVVHRLGALGAVWSMCSTTDFHRKSTVRGEADSWVHGRSKEVPPYYAENNYSSTDSWDPPDGPLYFVKKTFSPDCWDPPATSSHARKCVRAKKTIHPPDCWDPPATSSQARRCLTVGTHLVEAYVALSFWSRTCTYIYTGGCRGVHVS